MRAAAVLEAPRRLAVTRGGEPPLGPHDVRIRVEGCGVCGSDLPLWEGREWFQYPLEPGAPGHEAWGVVEEVGARVQGVTTQQRVTGLFHGAYAETATAPAAHVLTVPPELARQPLPAEAVACAVNAAERAGIRRGDAVAVVGIGFMGALLVQLARAAGADVTAASRRAFACSMAGRCGAQRAVQAAGPEHAAEVLAGRDGFDIVFEASGHQGSLDLATALVKTRGRLVVAGYHQDPRTVNMQQWNWKGIDVINAHERDPLRYMAGMEHALKAMAAGALDIRPLITHSFGLEEAGQAFEAMERREHGFFKGVVRP